MSVSVGVLDAGILLVRLDRRHRSHRQVVELLDRSAKGEIVLHISIVNLAEVLQHARDYTRETGLDPVALAHSFRVRLHAPNVDVARAAANLSALEDASLADRFAAATAEVLGARLHTTDTALSEALRRRKRLVTHY